MIDRWYYTHAGRTFGPVTAAQLRQMAAARQLNATDRIWPEGRDPSQGVEAQAALDFGVPSAPLTNKPDWLDDIRAAETTKPPMSSVSPDWLDDVRAAEEDEQEFLSLEWDTDPGDVELEHETPAKTVEPAGSSCRLVVGSATTRGRVRDRNEDSHLVQQCTWGNLDQRHDIALIVVADGMGGHNAGDRASGLVVRAVGNVVTPLLNAAMSAAAPAAAVLAETLDKGLQEANRLVVQTAKDDAACKGMGSTAVVVLVWDGRAFISLIGDCRVYHWRGSKLTQVTRDQTLVNRMVELGQLTEAEAEKHPRRNEVTQAVGKHGRLQPARYEVALQRGDWLVASCDGLYAHVDNAMLQEAIAKAGASASVLANRLIELANQGGGSDNCTVVTVHCP